MSIVKPQTLWQRLPEACRQQVIEELITFRRSERENRAIDHDEEGSMEVKKRVGYF